MRKDMRKDMSQEIRFTKIIVNLHIVYTNKRKRHDKQNAPIFGCFIYIRKATQKS